MRVQITNGMLMGLIINMVYAKAIGLTQGSMAREVGRDIWLSTIIANMVAAAFIVFVVLVIQRMPKGDLIEQGKKMIGAWFGKLLAIIFFLYFLSSMGPIMATFVYHLKDYFLPDAHTMVFIIVAMVVGCYAIYFGIEVIARMALVGVFSVLSLNILLLLGSIAKFDIRELLPIFESGVVNTAWAGRHLFADWTMVFMMIALILPNVKQIKVWKRSNLAGVLYGAGFILMWPIVETGVLSARVAGEYIVSCMQMARSAQIGVYIHRYEMIMVAFFAVSLLTQSMMSLYCASISLQKVFGLKSYRPLIIPVGLLFGGFGYWIVFDHARAMRFIEHEWIGISLSIAICVPLFIWFVGFALKDKLKNE
ncbi:GerAB/ArcD/ProY family transporter [Schinkia azotoformans]|uniref:GerAB/ArcD/ProY family transporter n=1 Tax=Schinkia azotoformans TaxID=1454 RepID=UPI002DB896C2|nr:GerAB/ArcD/ProY family transporter [Schinkia azotoformans]MEC1742479.1 GerAB/ArcD/ProY family transporter [Schinkia azotoformans]MEC1766162.1 GerAB/ArcD/ProY family transporter [Schinkia azotoformans]MEC1772347.1 GerAB/ArcD/ProY family transporter [Schinkia azotoformans]MEC1789117.1 GerAB/ArcD/ProY family transporter [Schinkia azotoformans]MED4365892.1 GerAB/ArcD/ProY family transporter [Schinkia azotoformans]